MALKLGINLGYWGIGPAGEEAAGIVKEAERLGYESVWVAESYGSDVVSVLAWLTPQTTTINLGAAIMQVPARPPAAAAMAGATIDKLSGGRFLFGFGPSGPQVSEGWYGVPYAKPWGRTREYIEVVREIIAREGPVEHHGEHYDIPLPGGEGKALKLNFHPERNEIPVFVGAIGRKSVEMAAEICDGWIPIFFSVDAFEQTWGEHLEAGFAKGGRQRSDLEVSPSLQVAIDGDLEAAKNVVKAGLVLYFGGMGSRKTNFYVDLAHRFGFGEVADEVQRRFQDGDRGGAFEATWGEHLEAGFAKGGRSRSDLEISPSLQVAIDGDQEAARNVVKAGLVLYFGGMGSRKTNFYVDLAHRFGFGEVADEVQRRFQDGDRAGAFEAMPDEIVEATSLVGSEAEVAERVERFRGIGIDRLIVSPVHVEAAEKAHTLARLADLAGVKATA